MSDSFADLQGQAMTDLIRFTKLERLNLYTYSLELLNKCSDGVFQNEVNRSREIPTFLHGLHSGTSELAFVEPSPKLALKAACFSSSLVRSCRSSFMTLFISLFVAVCCSKCVLLSSSSCLTLALEENTGRNAAGGREEEEGSNRDRGRGPLFRNSAGLEYLCCTISVHH